MAKPGSFVKGDKRAGRKDGSVNKTTKAVKEVFADVFSELQSDPKVKLSVWGKDNPTEFYKLASKLIPLQIGGDADNPLLPTLTDLQFEILLTKINGKAKANTGT